jgi:hypothetical protein
MDGGCCYMAADWPPSRPGRAENAFRFTQRTDGCLGSPPPPTLSSSQCKESASLVPESSVGGPAALASPLPRTLPSAPSRVMPCCVVSGSDHLPGQAAINQPIHE